MEPVLLSSPRFSHQESPWHLPVPTFTPAIKSPSFCRLCVQNAWPNLSPLQVYPRLLENKECCSLLHRHTHWPLHRPPSFLPSVSFQPQNSPVPFSNFLLPHLPSAHPLLAFLCLEWQSFFLWLYVFLPRRQLCCIIIHDDIISVYCFLFVFIPLKYTFFKNFKILPSLSWFNIFSSGLSHHYALSSHLSKIIYIHDKCW